jgi:hypothetical protein
MMKKYFLFLALVGISFGAAAQKNLSLGLKSGFMNQYKDMQYGFDAAYQWGPALELAFTGGFNPKILLEDTYSTVAPTDELSLYSANLDIRFYLIQQSTWATGPALGGQYISVTDKTKEFGSYNVPGFNLGWHGRVFVTDNLQINGGWRYTNAKEDHGYHFFYLGLAWTFELR